MAWLSEGQFSALYRITYNNVTLEMGNLLRIILPHLPKKLEVLKWKSSAVSSLLKLKVSQHITPFLGLHACQTLCVCLCVYIYIHKETQ